MTEIISFKERVKRIACKEAKTYKSIFVDHNYLLCSFYFKYRDYYILAAENNNFLHLVGVNTHLSPDNFFEKCFNATLNEDDFDFNKHNQDPKFTQGVVRSKIRSLPELCNIFNQELIIEEKFKKNKVTCAIATTNNKITIGFSDGKKSYPKTLLKDNVLSENAVPLNLILSKKKDDILFNHIVYGNIETIKRFVNIQPLLDNRIKALL